MLQWNVAWYERNSENTELNSEGEEWQCCRGKGLSKQSEEVLKKVYDSGCAMASAPDNREGYLNLLGVDSGKDNSEDTKAGECNL